MNFHILLLMSLVLVVAAASSSLTACDRRNAPTPTASAATTDAVPESDKTASVSPQAANGDRDSAGPVIVYVKPPYGASAPVAPMASVPTVAPVADAGNKPVVHGGVDQPPIVVPASPGAMASAASVGGGMAAAAAPEALLNGQPPAAGQTGTQPAPPLAEPERLFIASALDASLAELRLSQLAADKARNSIVKSYAALLISDQAALVNSLQRLTQQKGLPALLTLTETRQRVLETLASASPDAFDQAYLRAAGSVQNQALIALFEKGDRELQDPALKALVQSALPALRAHLSASEQLPVLG